MELPFALALIAGALLLWWAAARLQRQTGIPRARVIYDDASAQRVVPPPLVDHEWRLAGRPDYLLEKGGTLIPVEVKPSRRARKPYESDTMQLAAYCRLVEAHFGRRPPHGILRYAQDSFEIPYSAELERKLLELLRLMAESEVSEGHRSHGEAPRCRACSQRSQCDEALV